MLQAKNKGNLVSLVKQLNPNRKTNCLTLQSQNCWITSVYTSSYLAVDPLFNPANFLYHSYFCHSYLLKVTLHNIMLLCKKAQPLILEAVQNLRPYANFKKFI